MKRLKPAVFLLAVILLYHPSLSPDGALAASERKFGCSLALDGSVLAKVMLDLSEDSARLEYTLKIQGIQDITMAHLHLGKIGQIGSPIAWLYPPDGPPPKLVPGPFDGILARGGITSADLIGPMRGEPLSSLIAEIRAANVYVNIHTRIHPRGDICGPVYIVSQEP